jgi:hypothetical protein
MSIRRETEGDIVRACLTYLRVARGLVAWRNNTGARKVGSRFVRWGDVGSADILGILPGGRLLAIECKRKGNRPTPAQVAWHQMVSDAGALVIVATSVDDLTRQLATAGY